MMETAVAIKPGKMLIGGKWLDAAGGGTIDVMNPATGEHLTTVPDGQAADVDAAVRAARQSFEDGRWRNLDASRREQIVWRIGELIKKNVPELCTVESLENGKTVREARGADIMPAADSFFYYAGWVRKMYGETIPVDGPFL